MFVVAEFGSTSGCEMKLLQLRQPFVAVVGFEAGSGTESVEFEMGLGDLAQLNRFALDLTGHYRSRTPAKTSG